MASRSAKVRELLVPYVKNRHLKGKETSASDFQTWIDKEVSDVNYKLAVKIESLYGTAIWMYHAGCQANNFSITNAAITVFSGLFHVMGNHNYAQIEIFDSYLMQKCQKNAPELAKNLKKKPRN